MRHLMLLACAAMLLCVGCDGSDPAPIPPDEPGAPALAAYDLAGTWNRSTDVACAGTIDQTQFQALGLMQDHYYSADWMAIEQNGAEVATGTGSCRLPEAFAVLESTKRWGHSGSVGFSVEI